MPQSFGWIKPAECCHQVGGGGGEERPFPVLPVLLVIPDLCFGGYRKCWRFHPIMHRAMHVEVSTTMQKASSFAIMRTIFFRRCDLPPRLPFLDFVMKAGSGCCSAWIADRKQAPREASGPQRFDNAATT